MLNASRKRFLQALRDSKSGRKQKLSKEEIDAIVESSGEDVKFPYWITQERRNSGEFKIDDEPNVWINPLKVKAVKDEFGPAPKSKRSRGPERLPDLKPVDDKPEPIVEEIQDDDDDETDVLGLDLEDAIDVLLAVGD